jgi:diguanylate cyclase (GGDEF)-like protein
VCRVVSSVFHSPIALVSLSDTNRQFFKGKVGFDADELARELAPCRYAILGDEPLVVPDASLDPRFVDNPLVTNAPKVRFYVGAPLVTPDNYKLGTLCAIDVRTHAPTLEEVRALTDLSKTVMHMLNMRKAMTRARSFAMTDVLTGLANRAGIMLSLEDIITASKGSGSPFAILYLDVDNFKYVNDTRGHVAGDDVLQIIGEALSSTVRRDDTAGRLGGDEFAVLIPNCAPSESRALAERVMTNLTAAVKARRYPVGFSIGLAMFPTPPENVTEAFLVADRLMYAAKHGGKNRIVELSAASLGAGG